MEWRAGPARAGCLGAGKGGWEVGGGRRCDGGGRRRGAAQRAGADNVIAYHGATEWRWTSRQRRVRRRRIQGAGEVVDPAPEQPEQCAWEGGGWAQTWRRRIRVRLTVVVCPHISPAGLLPGGSAGWGGPAAAPPPEALLRPTHRVLMGQVGRMGGGAWRDGGTVQWCSWQETRYSVRRAQVGPSGSGVSVRRSTAQGNQVVAHRGADAGR